jgi:hypothetical protein
MTTISLFRLYVLRAMYAFIAFGLAATVWPQVLHGLRHAELMEGVVVCMLTAFSLLCLLGLRYPLRMLPVLLWETAWKTLWLLLVALPQWRAGHIEAAIQPTLMATSMVALVYLTVPWDFVLAKFVRERGDRWR